MPLDRGAVVTAMACAAVSYVLGNTYVPRLPNHAGYFLVPVDDAVRLPAPPRPRHTVFILVDGLRRDSAETMAVTRTLEAHGQCRVSDQGPYTVSRPVYALLSTGLEADRSGSRNNDLATPLAAESIWQVARAGGLTVTGSSHLPWFKQLFPGGFDRFADHELHEVDVFAGAQLADLNVFHPLYVDEAGHRHGARSTEYSAAVARADREMAGLLARLDLERDLVVMTADHGHRDEGGHGGSQPEIRHVLTCFAGPNIARSNERRAFDGRSTAPALALLLGLRFPRHMRAGDDGLDAIFELPRPGALDTAYLADRRAAVARFREANREAIEKWIGAPGTWPRLYDHEDRRRLPRLALLGIAAAALAIARLVAVRRDSGLRAALRSGAWIAAAPLLLWLTHRAVLGELDYTIINSKGRFILRALATTFAAALAGVIAHALAIRDRNRLVGDLLVLVLLLGLANTGHVFVYGWPLGFPVPSDAARYFPFFGAVAAIGYALVTIGAAIAAARTRRR